MIMIKNEAIMDDGWNFIVVVSRPDESIRRRNPPHERKEGKTCAIMVFWMARGARDRF